MPRLFKQIIGLLFTMLLLATSPLALANNPQTGEDNANPTQSASFQSRCDVAEELNFPPCASSPAECASNGLWNEPFNCEFLIEPIGGRTGYDLYKITTTEGGEVYYDLWLGEPLVGNNVEGPVQAILTFEVGKEIEGPFTLLYNYLGLVYNFMSGVIVALVILIVIVGGIRISTAGGNSEGVSGGKDMIIKAIVGMVMWFLASVILYTINPTFFTF